jgi:hypothetical protein
MEGMEAIKVVKRWVALVLFLLLAGCASHGVRCDGRLTPINASAPSASHVHEPRGSRTP